MDLGFQLTDGLFQLMNKKTGKKGLRNAKNGIFSIYQLKPAFRQLPSLIHLFTKNPRKRPPMFESSEAGKLQ